MIAKADRMISYFWPGFISVWRMIFISLSKIELLERVMKEVLEETTQKTTRKTTQNLENEENIIYHD